MYRMTTMSASKPPATINNRRMSERMYANSCSRLRPRGFNVALAVRLVRAVGAGTGGAGATATPVAAALLGVADAARLRALRGPRCR